MQLTEERLREVAVKIMGRNDNSKATIDRSMRACFGVSVMMACILWQKMLDYDNLPENFKPVHLLWCLGFIKTYETEDVLATMYKVGRDTLRKWVWKLLASIAELDEVSYEVMIILNNFGHTITNVGM
jgi:hypothetical protein